VQLFTSRYQRFNPEHGVPVRTTVGAPRFPLAYQLAADADLVKPTYPMLSLDEQPYRVQYTSRLDTAGVEAIRDELAAISAAAGDDRLVLLCFCDLSRPNAWCHRRMFAAWWHQQTGEEVPELAENPDPSLF
jgi:hypothetical protein